MTVRDAKRALRQRLLSARTAQREDALRPSVLLAASVSIRDRFLEAIHPAGGTVVSAFWPMPGELDMRPLLEALHARGCICALPVVTAPHTPLTFRTWEPGVVLVTSRFGIGEPGAERPVVRPSVSVVPLLAFDAEGYRIGYGGGFYDRTLEQLRAMDPSFLAVGVGLEAQHVAALPREAFDQPLDWIVTEAGATRFGR